MTEHSPGGDGADLGSAATGGPSGSASGAPVRVLLAGEPFTGAARRIAAELADETVASRLADGDDSVWPASATGAGRARPAPVAGSDPTRPGAAPGRSGPSTGWAGLARRSRPLSGQIAALRERFAVAGAHRVLLVGTPDAVAAARLVAAHSPGSTRLTALDSADPVQLAEALSGELTETVLVIADATGDDPVVGAVAHAVTAVLADEVGPVTLAARTVHLTEPGSPLDTAGAGATARPGDTAGAGDTTPVVITLDADVPGRFGALGPLGLVPAGLAGADVAGLLAGAVPAEEALAADDPDNPALLLAGGLAAARGSVLALRDEVRSPAVTAWLAPLLTAAGLVAVPAAPDETVPPVADGTSGGGDDGDDRRSDNRRSDDRRSDDRRDDRRDDDGRGGGDRRGDNRRRDNRRCDDGDGGRGDDGGDRAGGGDRAETHGDDHDGDDHDGTAPPRVVDVHADGTGAVPRAGDGAVRTDADPGATIVLWQVAAALAARVLGTDPFSPALPTPRTGPAPDGPAFVDEGVAVHAGDWLPSGVDTVAGALDALADVARAEGGHLTVSAWLDPESDASVGVLRAPLSARTGLPVAFGWAPGSRSGDTGAPDRAAHCHLTGGGLDDPDDLADTGLHGPGDDALVAGTAPEPSGMDSLHAAQARAVVEDQRRRGRPVLHLHLADRLTGLVTLARAVQGRAGTDTATLHERGF